MSGATEYTVTARFKLRAGSREAAERLFRMGVFLPCLYIEDCVQITIDSVRPVAETDEPDEKGA